MGWVTILFGKVVSDSAGEPQVLSSDRSLPVHLDTFAIHLPDTSRLWLTWILTLSSSLRTFHLSHMVCLQMNHLYSTTTLISYNNVYHEIFTLHNTLVFFVRSCDIRS